MCACICEHVYVCVLTENESSQILQDYSGPSPHLSPPSVPPFLPPFLLLNLDNSFQRGDSREQGERPPQSEAQAGLDLQVSQLAAHCFAQAWNEVGGESFTRVILTGQRHRFAAVEG